MNNSTLIDYNLFMALVEKCNYCKTVIFYFHFFMYCVKLIHYMYNLRIQAVQSIRAYQFNAVLDTTIQQMHFTAVQSSECISVQCHTRHHYPIHALHCRTCSTNKYNPDNSSRPNDIYITQVLCIEKYFDLVFFIKIFDICWLRYRLNSA